MSCVRVFLPRLYVVAQGSALAAFITWQDFRPVLCVAQVQIMASWWADAASSFVVFDEMVGLPTSEFAKGAEWRAKILHLLSLLHAVSIQYLLHNDAERTQLEVLGKLRCFRTRVLCSIGKPVSH